jgi:hypothetical protein
MTVQALCKCCDVIYATQNQHPNTFIPGLQYLCIVPTSCMENSNAFSHNVARIIKQLTIQSEVWLWETSPVAYAVQMI